MKKLFFSICMVLLISINADAQEKVQKLKKWEISFGGNFSELYTTHKDNGKIGFNFGIYKRKYLKNNWRIKYGIFLNKKQTEFNNILVFNYSMSVYDDKMLFTLDRKQNLVFIGSTLMFEKLVFTQNKYQYYLTFGSSYDFNIYNFGKTNIIDEKQYETLIDSYDFRSSDNGTSTNLYDKFENSGVSLILGNSIEFDQFILSLFYEYNIYEINHFYNFAFNEKFNLLELQFGIKL